MRMDYRKTGRFARPKTEFQVRDLKLEFLRQQRRRLRSESGSAPVGHRMSLAAVETRNAGQILGAIGAKGIRFKGIETRQTSWTNPKWADERRLATGGASETFASGQFRKFCEEASLHQATPAIQEHKQ